MSHKLLPHSNAQWRLNRENQEAWGEQEDHGQHVAQGKQDSGDGFWHWSGAQNTQDQYYRGAILIVAGVGLVGASRAVIEGPK